MSKTNPTALRVNAEGTIDGRWQIVLGRVVLSMEEGGERYYWNEFYLADKEGRTSTLVFEEMETGPTWKLFTLFEPTPSMQAAEASRARVGQKISVGGIETRVTLVDQSRVEFIEGSAPEGVEVGDVANYFNAEAEGWSVVVSWTGSEVECYNGTDLPRGAVAKAFNISEELKVSSYAYSSNGKNSEMGWIAVIGVIFVIGFVGIGLTQCKTRSKVSFDAPAPTKVVSAPNLLTNGARGMLHGWNVTVTGHAAMEVRQQGRWFERHEYSLTLEDGKSLLLIQNFQGVPNEWLLLFPKAVPTGFTAFKGAGFAANSTQYVEPGQSLKVLFLFRNDLVASETTGLKWPAETTYGFFASNSRQAIFARWSETGMQLFQGGVVPASEVLAALGAKK